MIGLDDIFTRLETALVAGGIAWWEIEFPSGVIFFSDNKATMLGYSPSKFTHYTHFTDLIHPEDTEAYLQAVESHTNGTTPSFEARYRIKQKDGTYAELYERGKVVSKANNITKLAGIVIDVGGQKELA